MTTWRQKMTRDARWVKSIRPDAFVAPDEACECGAHTSPLPKGYTMARNGRKCALGSADEGSER